MSIQEILFPIVYTTLFAFSAAFLLITRNDKFFSKLLFTLFTFSIAVWGWTNILAESYALIQYATLLAQVAFAAGLLAIFIFFIIALETLDLHLGLKKYWYVYFGLLVLLATNFFPNFIVGVPIIENGDINVIEGFGILFYFNEAILFLIAAFTIISISYRNGDIFTRLRIRPIILAMLFTACIGVTTNLIYPSLLKDESLTPYGPLSSITIIIALAYSILKWNLLGIYLKKFLTPKRYQMYWKMDGQDLAMNLRQAFISSEEKLGEKIRILFFPNGFITQSKVVLFGSTISFLLQGFFSVLSNVSDSFVSISSHNQKIKIWVKHKNKKPVFISAQNDLLQSFNQILFYKSASESAFTEHVKRSEMNNKI